MGCPPCQGHGFGSRVCACGAHPQPSPTPRVDLIFSLCTNNDLAQDLTVASLHPISSNVNPTPAHSLASSSRRSSSDCLCKTCPVLMATWKVAPALAAGCTGILKSSELALVTCLELVNVCREVGLPSGVLNVVIGFGPKAGAPLSAHPDINKVAFTGSYETGKKIMMAVAPMVKFDDETDVIMKPLRVQQIRRDMPTSQ